MKTEEGADGRQGQNRVRWHLRAISLLWNFLEGPVFPT